MFEIVEEVISRTASNDYHFDFETNEFRNYPQLRRLLLKDGFVIENGNLIRTFETDIDFNTNDTLLERLLNKHNLTTAKGHYNQATNAFDRGDWASCNGQLRCYVEELCFQIANKVTGNTYTDSHQARIVIEKQSTHFFIGS